MPDQPCLLPRPDHEEQALKAARAVVDEVLDKGYGGAACLDVLCSAAIMALCLVERLDGPVDRGALYARIERGAARAPSRPALAVQFGHA